MHQAKEHFGKRIALYGGAFDPVHCAHLEIARSALEQCQLDGLVFIPAAQSPLKGQGPAVSDAARLKMLELAVEGEERFTIEDCELRRGGKSYTVDTVRTFMEQSPDKEFCWLIGADQLEQLDRWHAIEELASMVTFLVVARPGHDLAAPALPDLRWVEVRASLMEESSSTIRERRAAGQSIHGIVSKAVEAFIEAEGLYI